MEWYYAQNQEQKGPVSESELATLVASGIVNDQTLVWCAGMANWQPYGQVRLAAAPGATLAPGSPGTFGHGAFAAAAPLAYAGFWVRLGAKLIDALILLVVLGVPLFVLLLANLIPQIQRGGPPPDPAAFIGMQVLFQVVFVLGAVVFNTFFIGRFGATPGKMVLGLKVVTPEGEPVTYLRAFGRAWAEQLSGMLCDLGYIIAAFDNEKRTLHDHLCRTRVVLKR